VVNFTVTLEKSGQKIRTMKLSKPIPNPTDPQPNYVTGIPLAAERNLAF
jgi:hypothetical protein